MVLAEPRGVVAVVQQDPADRGLVFGDDAVVAGIACCLLGDHTVADRMMIAAGDQRRAGGRTQSGRMEIGVAQAVLRNPVQRRRWNDAAECRGHAKAGIIGDDQKHIWRALRRDDARRPVRLRLRRVTFDLAAEFLRRSRKLITGNGGGGAGRTWNAVDLLGARRNRNEQRNAECDQNRLV
jgi:hypothetical protein